MGSPDSSIFAPIGSKYAKYQVKPYSYYNYAPAGTIYAGSSSVAGDASNVAQLNAIDDLVAAASNDGFTLAETAYFLAVVRVESGFNPNAAAGTTSAFGLGQLTNGAAYDQGINRTVTDGEFNGSAASVMLQAQLAANQFFGALIVSLIKWVLRATALSGVSGASP